MSAPLTKADFLTALAEQFELSAVAETSLLVEDLHFDSLQVFELVMWLEELGCTIPEDRLGDLHAVDDVFFYYVQGTSPGP